MQRRAFVGAAAASVLATAARANQTTTKILLLGKDQDHPPKTHEYMHECGMLAKCLRQTPGVEAVVSNGWPKDAKILEGVQAIALYTGNGGDVLFNGPQREQVEKVLRGGVGLVSVHWSTGTEDPSAGKKQLEYLGGWFSVKQAAKLVFRTAKVTRADASHPIARGGGDFDMYDEYYLNLKYQPTARPVLTVDIDNVKHTVGWTYERPKDKGAGKSFGFVCGHFHTCFANASFRRLIVNGILWSAGKDVPNTGAPCTVTDKDLELPPDPREKKQQ